MSNIDIQNTRSTPEPLAFVDNLPAYTVSASPEDIAKQFNLDRVTYLASNENPYGCSPKVGALLAEDITHLNRYPDSGCRNLKAALAELLALEVENLFLGNGSNEILESVARAYLGKGDEIIISEHSFAMYPLFAKAQGANVKSVAMTNWCVDCQSMLEQISERTKVIYIANPNNPTGTMCPVDDLLAFIKQVPTSIVVVIDEAYIEFCDAASNSLVSCVNDFPNLLVSRTFSKAYGLAGLRVGFGVAHASLVHILEKIRQPFNINSFALRAAECAAQDHAFLNEIVEKNAHERQQMSDFFDRHNIDTLPSCTNFITFYLGGEADRCFQYLLSCGVIIRQLKSYHMEGWLRVSLGIPSENEAFRQALVTSLGVARDQ